MHEPRGHHVSVVDALAATTDLPDEVQHKITVGNACRVYDFTPADPATIVPAGGR